MNETYLFLCSKVFDTHASFYFLVTTALKGLALCLFVYFLSRSDRVSLKSFFECKNCKPFLYHV